MWIKICGVTSQAAAEAVAAADPDAIGLNFYHRSPRCVEVSTAADIVSQLPAAIRPVGVFVNHTQTQIEEICTHCRIQTIQLHGDESADFIAQLSQYHIIRAFRVGDEGLDDVARQLKQYADRKIELLGCLVDARVNGAYGGTGHRAPWEVLAANWSPSWPPLILAGGLNPENIAGAISIVRPWGVDVASGVETAPGRQDPAAVLQLITRARRSRKVKSHQPRQEH